MDKSNSYTKNPSSLRGRIFYLQTFLLLLFLLSITPVSAQPKLKAEDTKKNFGFVDRGEVVVLEYRIYNQGSAPLLFTEADISCSCTTVEYSRQPIPPGQQSTVKIMFNTASVYGRQDREVILYSNDSASPLKLRYKGVVKNKKT